MHTLPISGDIEGYIFTDDWAKKCSYLHVLESLHMLTETGPEDFTMDNFYKKKFFLPFRLSHSINHYDPVTQERVQQGAISPLSRQRRLFLKFESNLTYVLRVSVIYFQHRSIKVSDDLKIFKNYDVDQ